MHIRISSFSLLVLFFSVLSFTHPGHTAVKEVILFPNAAKVTETAKVHPQCGSNEKCRVTLTLPSQTDPDSLIVSLPGASRTKIDDIQIKAITRQDEAKISELRKQIVKAKNNRNDLHAKLQALNVQLQFWQMQTKAKTKTVPDADNLSAAIGRNVKKANLEKFIIETGIEKIDKQLKELQDNLNQIVGGKETAWEATVTFSGRPNEVTLSHNYNIGGCGWLPLYRVEALPAEKKVTFSWEAQLWQSSGVDWKQAQIYLATMQPALTVVPPDLPEWMIKKRSRRVYESMRMEERSMAGAAAPLAKKSMGDEDQNVIEETIKTTYSVWSIGKKDIPAGAKQRLKIKEENWPADFLFLARPSLGQQAFVRAQVKLANSVDIPFGEALFLIDGAVLGKRNFSFAGNEGTLYFGTSPLISVTSSTLTNKTGEQTVFQNKQTQLWQWLIEAKNSSNNNIKLRIEEPAPQARDKRIHLTFKQIPEPTEKDHAKFIWIVDVPARQKITIQNVVELEAPKDLDLDLGWRR